MLLEDFIKERRNESLKDIVGQLGSIGFYAVFLEMAQRQMDGLKFGAGESPSEKALYQRGLMEGYKEAIFDLFYFSDRFVNKEALADINKPRADFGATDRLLKAGIITEEEANAIRNGQIKY